MAEFTQAQFDQYAKDVSVQLQRNVLPGSPTTVSPLDPNEILQSDASGVIYSSGVLKSELDTAVSHTAIVTGNPHSVTRANLSIDTTDDVTFADLTMTDANISGILNHDGSTLGFFAKAPASRTTAYTQTYSTASRTHSNPTASTLTDSSGGSATTTIATATNMDTLTDSTGGSANTTLVAMPGATNTVDCQTQIEDNFADIKAQLDKQISLNTVLINAVASLAAQINALIVDDANVKQVANQVIDDLQTYGLLQ